MGMPPDSGAAFVVVLHLSPEHESHLAEVLQVVTRMPVRARDRDHPARAESHLRHLAEHQPSPCRRTPDRLRHAASGGATRPGRHLLPDARRHPWSPRGIHRAVRHRARRIERPQAGERTRRDRHGAGPARERARRHAAQRDRNRAGALRPAGGGDAGQAPGDESAHGRCPAGCSAAARGRRPRRAAGHPDADQASYRSRLLSIQDCDSAPAHRPAAAAVRTAEHRGVLACSCGITRTKFRRSSASC